MLFFGLSVSAQKRKVLNLPNFDNKQIHFGFTLGFNTMDYIIEKDLTGMDSLISLQNSRQSGFNIGIVADLHIHKFLSLRFLPTLAFGQRDLEYTFVTNTQPSTALEIKQVESTYIEFPLALKYRSARYGNFAAYALGGSKFVIDLASQEDVDNDVSPQEQVIKSKKNFLMYEVGFGADFFMEYFKFSTEIKFSAGFNDILIQDNTIWSSPINKLTPQMITISFHFEG